MEIASLIINFVLGSGIIGSLLFYNTKRRKGSAEAYKLELVALKEEVLFLTDRLEKVREETSKLRDDFVALKEHSMSLELELIKEKHLKEVTEALVCTTQNCNNRAAQNRQNNERRTN